MHASTPPLFRVVYSRRFFARPGVGAKPMTTSGKSGRPWNSPSSILSKTASKSTSSANISPEFVKKGIFSGSICTYTRILEQL
jgi:hypothetical protein